MTGNTPDQAAERLRIGYHRFRAQRYERARELFRELGEAQDPDIMIIACADSRADPAMIFDSAPGELFVVRNVAALVPPFDESGGYHGVSAAVEFAVSHLKVKKILVMGHGGCGGVKASLAAVHGSPVGQFIAPWVSIADKVRDQVLADPAVANPEAAQKALERAAVRQSMSNLMTFPFVSDAVESGELDIDGAWFAIGPGELFWLDSETDQFRLVPPE